MNILLIEDHKPDAVLLRELLTENTRQAFHLVHAERLEEGLVLVDREHFDVALLDLSLPDAFGHDTFRRLHQQAPNLPIIVLTGLDDEDLAIKLAQAGAQDYLVKSDLNSGILHRSIHYAIERKVMEDQLKASEAKFRSIIEVCPVPMALHDEQLNITFLNPAFVQAFGYTLDDIPTLADWWPKAYPDPDYRRWVDTSWQTTLKKAKQEQTDFSPLESDYLLQKQQH